MGNRVQDLLIWKGTRFKRYELFRKKLWNISDLLSVPPWRSSEPKPLLVSRFGNIDDIDSSGIPSSNSNLQGIDKFGSYLGPRTRHTTIHSQPRNCSRPPEIFRCSIIITIDVTLRYCEAEFLLTGGLASCLMGSIRLHAPVYSLHSYRSAQLISGPCLLELLYNPSSITDSSCSFTPLHHKDAAAPCRLNKNPKPIHLIFDLLPCSHSFISAIKQTSTVSQLSTHCLPFIPVLASAIHICS